ncbi:MAG: DUF1292 domain-containing protein [Lachnospiraceae bacterium]|nr:DUF1292 domain-containing protein [Lachnospiraceae bacterium]
MAKEYSDISVDLDLDDGRTVTCDTITVLEVDGKRYIALAPREDNTDPEDAEIWFYGLNGDIEDEDKEPELIYIDDDETYDAVIDAFDEYLDELDFEELDD